MQINVGSKWMYVGGEDGYGLVHNVCGFDVDMNSPYPEQTAQVISWSDWTGDEDEGGWTWRGPLHRFLKSFKPLGPVEPDGVP